MLQRAGEEERPRLAGGGDGDGGDGGDGGGRGQKGLETGS